MLKRIKTKIISKTIEKKKVNLNKKLKKDLRQMNRGRIFKDRGKEQIRKMMTLT